MNGEGCFMIHVIERRVSVLDKVDKTVNEEYIMDKYCAVVTIRIMIYAIIHYSNHFYQNAYTRKNGKGNGVNVIEVS